MIPIVNRQANPSPEIEFSEIYIPDQVNIGTGSFTTRIKPKVLLTEKAVSSMIFFAPHFQLSVNLNPVTGKVPILLGRADGTSPLSRKVFLLPQNIDHNIPHNFIVKFQNWKIISFIMDTVSLEPVIDQVDFFRQLSLFLEKLVPDEWFNNPKNHRYPAYQRWAFFQRMIAQNGILRFPEQKNDLALLGQFLLDAEYLKLITEEDYFDQLLEPVKVKIANYLMHPTQFDDIMLEIAITAWHQMRKHKAELFEVSNYPDVKVTIPGMALPVYVECKNIMTGNENSIKHIITHANGQLKKVSEAHYGIVILNIAKPIELKRVFSDAYPERVDQLMTFVKQSLTSSRHRSVGAAILIWDDFIQYGDPPQKMLIAYRRRSVRIDHTPAEGCIEIPQNAELFEGNTSEFTISWQSRT